MDINKINARIQHKIDAIDNWKQSNPLILKGEIAVVICENEKTKIKIGDGEHHFNDLPYVLSGLSRISLDGGKSFVDVDEFNFIKISEEGYNQLVKDEAILSNAIYEVDYANLNCFNERLTNLGSPVDDSDAATKQYVDSKTSSIKVPTKVSELTNDSGFLTAHQSLDNYYDKTQVDEISANLAGKSVVRLSIPESNVQKDLSVLNIMKLTQSRYDQMQQDGSILSDYLYIVQQDDNGIIFGGNSFTC